MPQSAAPQDAAAPVPSPDPVAAGADRQSARVLLNVKSGRGTESRSTAEIAEAFEAQGMSVEITRLRPRDDISGIASELAREGAKIVVAAGGDGTMSGIAAGLAGTDTAMGVLPMGTFNYLARSLEIPQTLDGAIKTIAAGHRRRLNVGMVNDALFLNNASFGIYPQILRRRESVYARWGRSRAAAYWSVLSTMARLPRPLSLRITANGKTWRQDTPLAFAVANPFQLRHMGLEGAEEIEAGRIALLLAPDVSRARLLANGLSLMLGRAEKNREFELITADDIRIEARRKSLLVARDGERSRIKAPFRLRLRKGGLTVLAPKPGTEGSP